MAEDLYLWFKILGAILVATLTMGKIVHWLSLANILPKIHEISDAKIKEKSFSRSEGDVLTNRVDNVERNIEEIKDSIKENGNKLDRLIEQHK
jgi:hypothetical protein